MIRAALLTLLLSGCAHLANCPPLPGGPAYCLQATTRVPAFAATQDVRIQRREIDERLITQLEVDSDGMRLAALTPMGQRVLGAHFDNLSAVVDGIPDIPQMAKALLSLIQIAIWPEDSVQAGLGADWQVIDQAGERRVMQGRDVVMMVERTGSAPRYRHLTIRLPRAELILTIDDLEVTGQ